MYDFFLLDFLAKGISRRNLTCSLQLISEYLFVQLGFPSLLKIRSGNAEICCSVRKKSGNVLEYSNTFRWPPTRNRADIGTGVINCVCVRWAEMKNMKNTVTGIDLPKRRQG